ncbi:MAG TPA: L-aspartate oxidase [Candidatus Polarisedimenticolaceae bacterium]
MAELVEAEVLVLGSGIAGGVTALRLADAGIPVVVATRAADPGESNTIWAQGGIIYRGHDDSAEKLAEDVARAGAGHCNPEAVAILASEGADRVREVLLERLEVPFDRDDRGGLALAREGGHTLPRILHAADFTGRAIEEALVGALRAHRNVRLLTSHTAVDLLTPSHHASNRLHVYDPPKAIGAYLLERDGDRVVRCVARKTVLATGGLGQIFLRTTNPAGARGDGLAMAVRAGARVINAEFIQFHPTTFFHPHAPRLLISEAVRGDGARLTDAAGQPFMQRYDPEWRDLAPRDVVARGIHQEMLEHGVPNVFLDLRSYIPRERILEHFPTIHRDLLAYGTDVTKDLVPVVPAAHYACGGVWVDAWGRTTIRDLYAVGEVACSGVHGANRLASTSLLEGVVWGCRAAADVERTLTSAPPPDAGEIPPWRDAGRERPDPALVAQDMSSIQHIMWNYVGLVRTTPRLERALHELRSLEWEVERFYRRARMTDGLVGLRNAVRTAAVVAQAAWENKRSMGCHYRV